ncbi:hypothetical protein [Methylotenera sp.]|uniref:hypothetical protein n=1 Tax=Methylotenera sp. TaxID=2051956 RepID=UPI00248966A8|nr:hypothetical protein [Methylotenera sp.]MDI1298605.1 hypothetical protein [Methylotenera sp.]
MRITFYKSKSVYQLQTETKIVAFVYGEMGYWPVPIVGRDITVSSLNYADMTDEILESAEVGSMFGWDLPLAQLAKDYAERRLAESQNKESENEKNRIS